MSSKLSIEFTKEEKKILEAFGKQVRSKRRAMNISQEDLAGITEIDRTYISNVETGARNIGLLNLIKISKALKLNLNEIIK